MNEKGLGGRETALVQLSENWAKMGHEVINFVPTEEAEIFDYGAGSSRYIPKEDIIPYCRNFGADVIISWEEAGISDVPEIVDNVALKIVEMQVAHLAQDEAGDKNIDYYAVLSDWAGEFIQQQHKYIDPEKIVVFKNCIDPVRYSVKPKRRKENRDFFYSSSPDRGLVNVLRMWPKIKERYPEANLHVMYGVENWVEAMKWSHNIQAEIALNIEEGLKQDGIIYHGKVGQDELAEIQRGCVAMLYPCETFSPTETGCISVVEACAAGAIPFITDEDCLGPEYCDVLPHVNLPLNDNDYLEMLFSVLETEYSYDAYFENALYLASTRLWPDEAGKWIEFFEQELYITGKDFIYGADIALVA